LKKNGNKTGQVRERISHLTYSQSTDEELCDWVHGCMDLGYIITRELLRGFKGSDSWMDTFLRRHGLSLRALNEGTKAQTEVFQDLSTKIKFQCMTQLTNTR